MVLGRNMEASMGKKRKVRVVECADEGPTAETVRKNVKSAVAVLIERHAESAGIVGLDPACGQAALEIAAVYVATTAGLWAKTARYGERMPGGTTADWSDAMVAANRRYRAWLDMALQDRRAGTASVRDVVLDAAVDGLGLRQIADRRGMDQRTVEKVLRESLEAYAVMAGWMRRAISHAA